MQRANAPANVSPATKSKLLAATILAAMALTGCGGGGGDDPPSSPATQPPPTTPPSGNTAPTVSAGADRTIELPVNALELQGTATDADTAQTLTIAWTANPAAGVTFDNPASPTSRVTFTSPGTYELTLSANDGTVATTDAVAITVSPAVYPSADSETDPNHGWLAASPADVGMDAAKLLEAQTYALTGGGAGLISRRGRLVQQWGDIDIRFDIKSTTKSMGSIALGLAIDRSLLALTDTAQSRLPGLGSDPADTSPTPNDPTLLTQITIEQLATHTAGFAKPGGSDVDLLYAPGTKWTYSDGGLNWLADTLTNVFQQDLSSVLTSAVWTPLGITTDDLTWRAVPVSTPRPPVPNSIAQRELASGMVANANAMARIGLLFLRKGVWNDQRILSEEFIQTASTPRPATAAAELIDPAGFPSANEGYGLLWWTNAARQLPDVPADAYWAWGLGDSLIVVIPSLDLVIARTGNSPDERPHLPKWRNDWNGNYEVLRPFLTPIVQAVTPTTP